MNAANKPGDTTVEAKAEQSRDASALTGYNADVRFLASRYKQGGRTTYSLDLTPSEIASVVTPPNPDVPTDGNRAIRPAHADGFAKYIRQREDWVSPSMMLRAPKAFDFEVRDELEGIQFGVLSISRRNLSDLRIIDGQHRILGIVRAEAAIADDLDRARSNLANARRIDEGGAGEKEARRRIAELEAQRERLGIERINVQIIIQPDAVAYKQMFYDVADNALGISASVRSRFDSRKVVHRALSETMSHPLLKNRVDPEGDRIGRGSPFIMGAKHVSELIRTTAVGLDGRVSRRQEEEFKEAVLAQNTKEFFTVLAAGFPIMKAVEMGTAPDELRKTSLLGSVLFVRILAGAFYDLIHDHAWTPEMVQEFFEKLAPHMSGPVYEGSIWTTHQPDLWVNGAMAPRSRRQDLTAVKNGLVEWALDKPAWLDAAPKPRPVAPVEEDSSEDEKRRVDGVIAARR